MGLSLPMRHLRALRRLRLRPIDVCRHHAQRRVFSRPSDRQSAFTQVSSRVREPVAAFRQPARQNLARRRVDHVADRVHRRQRAHHQIARSDRSAPQPALHRALRAEQLSNRRPRARAHVALLDRVRRRRLRRSIARLCVRPNRPVAHVQVKQNRRRHDRHLPAPRREPGFLFFEEPHHPVGRRQPERRSARQADPMHLLNRRLRPQQIRLARPRPAAAHVHPGHGARPSQNRRTPGRPPPRRPVPNLHPRHVRQRPLGRRSRRRNRRPRSG